MLAPIDDEHDPYDPRRVSAITVGRQSGRDRRLHRVRRTLLAVNEDRSLVERFIRAYMFLFYEDRDGAMRALRVVPHQRFVSTLANLESRVRRAHREASMPTSIPSVGMRQTLRRRWD